MTFFNVNCPLMEVNRPIPGRKFRRKGRLPVQGLRTRLQERIA